MNINHRTTRLGFELAHTLEYMIKYYNCGLALCKTDKRRNILSKELDRIKHCHRDLTMIPQYRCVVFDISDCENKAKNLMISTLFRNQLNAYHEKRRRKA